MKIELSLLHDLPNEEEFRLWFSCSKNLLKKLDYHFRPLMKGEVISLPSNLINHLKINPHYTGAHIPVLYEDELFLVLDKPANLHVHPHEYEESDNCLSFLKAHRPELLEVNAGAWDRGLLYRLDYGTSGVLFYVKKSADYFYFREHFSKVAKKKIYLAIVDGLLEGHGNIKNELAPFGPGKKKMRVVSRDGHSGELNYRVLVQNKSLKKTLVEISLKTGLRHQIRAQMAHMGYPLFGDDIYGGTQAERLFLHASSYCINDVIVTAPVPQEFLVYFKISDSI